MIVEYQENEKNIYIALCISIKLSHNILYCLCLSKTAWQLLSLIFHLSCKFGHLVWAK